ncbi:MAG: tRNA (adenosine(37)-N6)-dimethylallyltransferase MiaA [Pedobacter sp.]|nr:MAG: tRNA (adenosine(37)-N6)-dimethylallyltransferase MiaA [Pedobacter sp.]
MQFKPLLILIGATASGKTRFAIELAKRLNAEIISADSRQVYKRMDIGTGKDLDEYLKNHVPYHLIDILEPGTKYHVDAFKKDFYAVYNQLQAQNKMIILCGGTALYINSLIQPSELTSIPINPIIRSQFENQSLPHCIAELKKFPTESWKNVDFKSHKRVIRALEIAHYLKDNPIPTADYPKLNPIFFGLVDEVETRRLKIKKRLQMRLKDGLIEEVKGLMEAGLSFEMLEYYGLEYKFIGKYLKGELSYTEMEAQLYHGICQYAKRQMTFFRKMDREGAQINWIDASLNLEKQVEVVSKLIKA